MHDGVQHIAGIGRTVFAAYHQLHPIGIGKVGNLLAFGDNGLVDLLLLIGENRLHAATGTDDVERAGVAQNFHGLGNDGGGVDFVHVQLLSVGGQAVFDFGVGVANHQGSGVLLLVVGIRIDEHGTGQRNQENEEAELLQVSEQLKLFHLRAFSFLPV